MSKPSYLGRVSTNMANEMFVGIKKEFKHRQDAMVKDGISNRRMVVVCINAHVKLINRMISSLRRGLDTLKIEDERKEIHDMIKEELDKLWKE